jgi:hypothetical protein
MLTQRPLSKFSAKAANTKTQYINRKGAEKIKALQRAQRIQKGRNTFNRKGREENTTQRTAKNAYKIWPLITRMNTKHCICH